MRYGLSDDEFAFLERVVVGPLRDAGADVYIFGSRARGDHQKFSDIDLLIDAPTDLSALTSSLSEQLEQSNFPFKVDLVSVRDLAPSYQPSVLRDRKKLEPS